MPDAVQLLGASSLPPELCGTQLEVGVFGRWPGPDPALSPQPPQACQPLDSLALLDHTCSAFHPSPPAARPEVPSDQAWPTAQPAFGYRLNGLYDQEVTRPLVSEEVRLLSPPCLWGPVLPGSPSRQAVQAEYMGSWLC